MNAPHRPTIPFLVPTPEYGTLLFTMANIEVTQSGSEGAIQVIRKFSRRMQSSGIVQRMRSRRYYSRDMSQAVKKKKALKRISRQEEYAQLLKEGKVSERPTRPGSRRNA